MDLSRVQQDLAAGRLWKARDRLLGMRSHVPADQKVLELLGSVNADMGDLPAAGLAWFLTEGEDPRREDALAAVRERYRGSDALAAALTVRAGFDDYPPAVSERLRALQADVPWWTPRPATARREEPRRGGDTAVMLGCIAAAAIAIVPWVAGVIYFVRGLV